VPIVDRDKRRKYGAEWKRFRWNNDPVYRAKKLEEHRQWRRDNPEKHALQCRRHRLRRQFGLTVKQYDKILERQKGRCALCDALPKPKMRLDVDHDHRTGEVRGLLCGNCNILLGHLEARYSFVRIYMYLSKKHAIPADGD